MLPAAAETPRTAWRESALIAVAAVVPFLTGVTAPFTTWDDNYYVTLSERTHAPGWAAFKALWSFPNALHDLQVEFFPLRDSVYWVLWQVFGENPVPFHLTNLALHLATALLVRALALRLGFSAWAGLAAALLFATHPIHVESVTWVAALKDPLFLSQMLGAMVLYLRYRETLRPRDYGLCLLLLAGALASKSLALPTVLLMVAAERLVGAPTRWKLIAQRIAGPALLTALSLAHILAIGTVAHIVLGPHGGSWSAHWQLMAWALVRYVQQAFVPATFRLHYCFPPPEGLADARVWVALVALPAFAALGLWAWRKNRRLAFVWVWFFACLAPVANFVPFPSLMADRYLYAPSVAAALALAWVLEQTRARRVLLPAAVAVFAAITASQALLWHDQAALWDEVMVEPACWQDPSLLATNVVNEWASHRKEPRDAVQAYQRALQHPGVRHTKQGEMCGQFRRSVLGKKLEDPALEGQAAPMAAQVCPASPFAWERLALARWRTDPAEAARAMERVYALQPLSVRRWQLGLALLNAGDARAQVELAAALRQDPRDLCPMFEQWSPTATDAQRPTAAALAPLCP